MLGEHGLGVFEFAELGFPAGLEAAGDEAILRLAGMERALGADRVIAGAFDAQLERAVGARASFCDLVGSSERERDLLGCERREQPRGDELVDNLGLDLTAAGRIEVGPR